MKVNKKVLLSMVGALIILIIGIAIVVLADEKEVEFKIPYNEKIHGKVGTVMIGNMEAKGIIYGEAEMTVEEARKLGVKELGKKNLTEKVKVKYPKVVMIKDEKIETSGLVKLIRFLDKGGGIKKEIDVKKKLVVVSKNEKYICVNKVFWTTNGYGVESAEATILDTEGNILRKIRHPYSSSIFVSPNGEYIVGGSIGEYMEAPIGVYTENGLVTEIKRNADSWQIDFSKDGSFGLR